MRRLGEALPGSQRGGQRQRRVLPRRNGGKCPSRQIGKLDSASQRRPAPGRRFLGVKFGGIWGGVGAGGQGGRGRGGGGCGLGKTGGWAEIVERGGGGRGLASFWGTISLSHGTVGSAAGRAQSENSVCRPHCDWALSSRHGTGARACRRCPLRQGWRAGGLADWLLGLRESDRGISGRARREREDRTGQDRAPQGHILIGRPAPGSGDGAHEAPSHGPSAAAAGPEEQSSSDSAAAAANQRARQSIVWGRARAFDQEDDARWRPAQPLRIPAQSEPR